MAVVFNLPRLAKTVSGHYYISHSASATWQDRMKAMVDTDDNLLRAKLSLKFNKHVVSVILLRTPVSCSTAYAGSVRTGGNVKTI